MECISGLFLWKGIRSLPFQHFGVLELVHKRPSQNGALACRVRKSVALHLEGRGAHLQSQWQMTRHCQGCRKRGTGSARLTSSCTEPELIRCCLRERIYRHHISSIVGQSSTHRRTMPRVTPSALTHSRCVTRLAESTQPHQPASPRFQPRKGPGATLP